MLLPIIGPAAVVMIAIVLSDFPHCRCLSEKRKGRGRLAPVANHSPRFVLLKQRHLYADVAAPASVIYTRRALFGVAGCCRVAIRATGLHRIGSFYGRVSLAEPGPGGPALVSIDFYYIMLRAFLAGAFADLDSVCVRPYRRPGIDAYKCRFIRRRRWVIASNWIHRESESA